MHTKPRPLRFVTLAVAATLLTACGNKGQLTLPPRPDAPKPPAQAKPATPKPVEPAAEAGKDLNSSPAPATQ